MNILVIGSGAREDALCQKLRSSAMVDRVLCTPGNGGIHPADRRDLKETDFHGIVKLVRARKIDFVIFGPETSLVAGGVDFLQRMGIPAFGPSREAARLEGSKIFTYQSCIQWNMPTAFSYIPNSFDRAYDVIKKTGFWVIKADGLFAGKGVVVAETEEEALAAAHDMMVANKYGEAGRRILIAERLYGDECSVMALCDGENAILLPPAQDFKRIGEGDTGLNTGGTGALSPPPGVDDALLERIRHQFILPTLRGMAARGTPFHGLLYAGLMLTAEGPKLIEYNVRFGDPEVQVVLARVKSDITPYLLATCTRGGLSHLPPVEVHDEAAVCTVRMSKGYPGKYDVGFPITGIEEAKKHAQIFHAGTKRTPKGLVTSGGRVLSVVGRGKTLAEARMKSLLGVAAIQCENLVHRRDIAEKAANR